MTYPDATLLIDEMLDKLSGIGNVFGVPPDDLRAVSVVLEGTTAKITFTAGDTIIDGVTFATTAGVLLRRGENHFPENILDGDFVYNFTGAELHAYESTPFLDENLNPGSTYYYRFFPYTTREIYNYHGNTISVSVPRG